MPLPISTTRTGTGWTIDVTSLVLSTNLGYKDFYVKVSGLVSPLASYTKTSPTLLTYSGVALSVSSPLIVFRDSLRLVDDANLGDINSSGGLNAKFSQVEVLIEDLRQLIGVVV